MITNSVARKVVGVEYTLLRAPLGALDRRLPAESKVRTTLERGLGGLDAVAARLLGGGNGPSDDTQGSSPATKPSTPAGNSAPSDTAAQDAPSGDAAPADAAAAPADSPGAVVVDATETLDQSPEAAEERVEEEVERVSDELVSQLEETPLAGELADAGEDDLQRMADLRAKHIVEQYEAEQAAKRARDDASS